MARAPTLLREIRLDLGLSQRAMAHEVGVDRSTLSRIELRIRGMGHEVGLKLWHRYRWYLTSRRISLSKLLQAHPDPKQLSNRK